MWLCVVMSTLECGETPYKKGGRPKHGIFQYPNFGKSNIHYSMQMQRLITQQAQTDQIAGQATLQHYHGTRNKQTSHQLEVDAQVCFRLCWACRQHPHQACHHPQARWQKTHCPTHLLTWRQVALSQPQGAWGSICRGHGRSRAPAPDLGCSFTTSMSAAAGKLVLPQCVGAVSRRLEHRSPSDGSGAGPFLNICNNSQGAPAANLRPISWCGCS